jgi:hypothetical protein
MWKFWRRWVMKYRVKLRELRDADVRFISLVDRAASRIPFRVLKRDGETEMGIDLTGVFKRGEQEPKVAVAEVVVFAQQDATLTDAVRQSIATAGFDTKRVRKADEDTLVYSQMEDAGEDTHMVRISDQMVVVMKGLDEPKGMFGEIVREHGFFPGMSMAMGLLHERVRELVTKSESPAAEIHQAMEEFTAYAEQLHALPPAVFKADDAINQVIDKALAKKADEKKVPDKPATDAPSKDGVVDPKGTVQEKTVPNLQSGGPGSSSTTVSKCDKCTDAKKCDPAMLDEAGMKAHGMKDEDIAAELAKRTQKKDDKKDEKKEEKAVKSEMQTVLDAIAGVTTKVAEVATQVESVVKTQSTFKETLDGVVEKQEAVEERLKSTVLAPPNAEDRPAGSRTETRKSDDDDPRKGCFDTAFIARGRRNR